MLDRIGHDRAPVAGASTANQERIRWAKARADDALKSLGADLRQPKHRPRAAAGDGP